MAYGGDAVPATIGARKGLCSFLMWSDGPNRVDENCGGDDVWMATSL